MCAVRWQIMNLSFCQISAATTSVISRKNIIQYVANKDGGAHVDLDIPEDYDNLKNHNSINWKIITSKGEKPFENDVVYASIRQMTYEILVSLYMYRKDWFSEEYF